MVMDSLLSMLFFLFTCFFLSSVSSSAPELSYNDHCASTVPEVESTPTELKPNAFPLGKIHTGYYTGGDRILSVGSSWQRNSFYFRTQNMHAADTPGLFKIEGKVSFRSSTPYVQNSSYGEKWYYEPHGPYRKARITIMLDGFWSESSGNLCMIGTGSGYLKRGNFLHLEAVFKLNNVFNASNITSLVSGSLESLSSENAENFFEPISVLMLPRLNYNYTLDSIEADNEYSSGSDSEKGLSVNPSSFCSPGDIISRAVRGLYLEYSSDCNSTKNCTPISGFSDYLPSLMSMEGIECPDTKKNRLRVLIGFNSYFGLYQDFNPKTMLVGEGWWDEKKNRLCVVACHFMGLTPSLASARVGDCSVRLKLRLPSIWSINDTSSVVGQIWSSKTMNDPNYFKRISFRTDDDYEVEFQGLKYEYSKLDKVRSSCPRQKPVINQERRYPDAYSYNMRFDMSVRESKRRVAWGYSTPLSVDDEFYSFELSAASDSSPSSSKAVPVVHMSNISLFNISYRIRISPTSNLAADDKNSLFGMSFQRVKIRAEGIYDAGAGSLCMVGCRNLHSNNGTTLVNSVDCEILLKFQFPSLDGNNGSYIEGRVESTRKKSDPLYFKPLDLSSAAFYTEAAIETVWRMDMEIIMVLISTSLACVFVGLQLYHVKRHPKVIPFISLLMLSILILGHMIPLVLNFEALFTQNPNNKNFVLGNVGWLEVNEITARLITMVAFLLQFRLLQLTWSGRKTGGSQKSFWVAERKSVCVTLPLYAAGFLIAFLVKWIKNADAVVRSSSFGYQHHSSWDVFKSYGGLVLDGFLLPQIVLNLFSNLRENALSLSFYFGTTFVRLLPHAYDFYRVHNYGRQVNETYYYADPSADYYSTAWDIVIPLGGLLFAVIICLQQRFGGHCILPQRFRMSEAYEKVPVVTEAEAGAEGETSNA